MIPKILLHLKSGKIQTPAQIILGGIFIYAGLGKVSQPGAFADIIANYKLLSPFLIKLAAVVLPWVELIFGMLLVLNLFPRISASVLSSLLVIFIAAIGLNLFRGIHTDCGCFFKLMAQSASGPSASIGNMWYTIIRDIFLLIPGITVIFFSEKRKPGEEINYMGKWKMGTVK